MITDTERNILLNQFVIMSALEILITEKTQDYYYEARQLRDRMEDIAQIIDKIEL